MKLNTHVIVVTNGDSEHNGRYGVIVDQYSDYRLVMLNNTHWSWFRIDELIPAK